jgi:hypothetical protein
VKFGLSEDTIQKIRAVLGYKILTDPDDLLLPFTIDLSIFNDNGDPDVIEHIQRMGVMF